MHHYEYKSDGTEGQGEEEGQPAEDEHPHHHAQSLRRLLLSGELHQFEAQSTATRILGIMDIK